MSRAAPAFALYLITDGWSDDTAARVDAALGALPAGTAAVQLRCKTLATRDLLAAATELRAITSRRGAPLFVNDRVDVALAASADGVHLPARGLPPKSARRVCGDRLWIGCSTHSLEEAGMAARGGADLVTFGPVWATESKAAYGAPVGLAALREVVARVAAPVYALGGVSAARVAECRAAGARVACIGAVLGRSDSADAARSLGAALGVW